MQGAVLICDVELRLKTEMHTTGTGPLELLASAPRGERLAAMEKLFNNLDPSIYKFLKEFKYTFNALPRFYKSLNNAVVYIPGSTFKGVLRSLLDAKGLESALNRLGPDVEQKAEMLKKELEKDGIPIRRDKDGAYRALLIDKYSHAVLAAVYEELYHLNKAPDRRKLVEKVMKILNVDNEGVLHYKHYLGLSEVLFGTTGLKSAIEVTNLMPQGDVKTVIRTFNAVARNGKTANPYHIELVGAGAVFKGQLIFRENVLATSEDFEEFLKLLNCKGAQSTCGFEIQLGKRKKMGWGKAEVTLICR